MLRTLTSAAGNDALPPLLWAKRSHEVVRPPDLETEDLLQVFSLQPYLVPQFGTQIRRIHERRFFQNIVYFRGQDETEVIRRLGGKQGVFWDARIVDRLWRMRGIFQDCRRRHGLRVVVESKPGQKKNVSESASPNVGSDFAGF